MEPSLFYYYPTLGPLPSGTIWAALFAVFHFLVFVPSGDGHEREEEASDSRDPGHRYRRQTSVSGHTWSQRALPNQVSQHPTHSLPHVPQLKQLSKYKYRLPPPSLTSQRGSPLPASPPRSGPGGRRVCGGVGVRRLPIWPGAAGHRHAAAWPAPWVWSENGTEDREPRDRQWSGDPLSLFAHQGPEWDKDTRCITHVRKLKMRLCNAVLLVSVVGGADWSLRWGFRLRYGNSSKLDFRIMMVMWRIYILILTHQNH